MDQAWRLQMDLSIQTPGGIVDASEGDILILCDTPQGKDQLFVIPTYLADKGD